MLDLDVLDFAKGGGYVTVVCQDATTRQVLMVARADREALERTLATGEMHYHSRSRGLWHKGATSGHVQRVVALAPDCDGDALLALVRPAGPACHTGAQSCFGGETGDGSRETGGGSAVGRSEAAVRGAMEQGGEGGGGRDEARGGERGGERGDAHADVESSARADSRSGAKADSRSGAKTDAPSDARVEDVVRDGGPPPITESTPSMTDLPHHFIPSRTIPSPHADPDHALRQLAGIIAERQAALPLPHGIAPSYTQRLLIDRNLRLKKLGEEASELAVACADQDRERAAEEGGDVIYHTLVALAAIGVSVHDVARVLASRAR
jgi:phosphoribosyl-ATP pyrophosphohydrolase